MKSTYYEILLTHGSLFEAYKLGQLKSYSDLERHVAKLVRDLDSHQPDHFYEPYTKLAFPGKHTTSSLLLMAFQNLSEMLHIRNDQLYVEFGQFNLWQHQITAISPLPLIAYAYFRHYGHEQAVQHLIDDRPFQHCLLPLPFHPMLFTMLRDQPPKDLHVHLNGTTQADFVWQLALQKPSENYNFFKQTKKRKPVQQQYLQMGLMENEESMLKLLFAARALRDKGARFGLKPDDDKAPFDLTDFLRSGFRDHYPPVSYRHHPCQDRSTEKLAHHELEMIWWLDRFRDLKERGSDCLAQMVHVYLLMQSLFYRMLVQQRSQKGFDQFQKITLNELRRLTEQEYEARFLQLGSKNQISFLEGRFAPKEEPSSMMKLLDTIIRGYEKFQGAQHPHAREPLVPEDYQRAMQLRLVVHFIKEEDKEKNLGYSICRHLNLRRKLWRQARVLADLRNKEPRLGFYLTGADAASNELHAPPEVFAPIFRYLRRAGWSDFTYHVGEDYHHMVSGIRAVWEAVRFLGLRSGNRIGHGTVIGIDPAFWLQQCPRKQQIARGEWLDNLLFIYFICLENNQAAPPFLTHQIMHHWREIYCSSKKDGEITALPDVDLMLEAWKNRGWDPLHYLREPDFILDRWFRLEAEAFEVHRRDHVLVFDLLKQYHQVENRKRAAAFIEVDAHLFSAELLRLAQDTTIEYLNKRVVAVESMLTSNVRIAPYSDFKDHHLFRWLNIPYEASRPCPTVVLASDDPGIFANNLPADYAHLLETLVVDKHLSHKDAMVHLKQLNENGNDFLFGQENLHPKPRGLRLNRPTGALPKASHCSACKH